VPSPFPVTVAGTNCLPPFLPLSQGRNSPLLTRAGGGGVGIVRACRPSHSSASLSRAILDLKTQRDKLHQYQRRIRVLTAKETDVARQCLAKGDKKRALLALRRKKYQESLLTQTDAQLEQLEQLMRSVEFAQIQKDVLFGLQQGNRVLKAIHAEMGGLEHVEKLMGETQEAIAYQNVRATTAWRPRPPSWGMVC
jgi:hypothetical protein